MEKLRDVISDCLKNEIDENALTAKLGGVFAATDMLLDVFELDQNKILEITEVVKTQVRNKVEILK